LLLTELLSPDRVVVPLPAGDRPAAIAGLAPRRADPGGGGDDEVRGGVLERG
jgi:hypothetical protein